MEYNRIISITGLSGLFELKSSKSDGAIVASLEDKTPKFVSSRLHNFSHLESIEIYTSRENVNLVEIFQTMENSNEALPDLKSNSALKSYFEKVYPEMDFERVYSSDMKKMVKWFQQLKKNNVEIKLSNHEPVEVVTESAPAKETQNAELVDEKPKAVKKKATKKESENTNEDAEAKPKKTTKKKKTEE